MIPARLTAGGSGAAREPAIEATLHQAARRLALARLREAGQAARTGRRRALRRGGQGLLPRPARRHGRGQRRGRRGDAGLRAFTGRCSTRRSPSAATCRCRPISRAARAGRARPRRLPDHVRARGGRGRGADRGPAFHRRAAGGSCARGVALHRDAACRRRAPSCRSRPTTPPATACTPEWGGERRDRRGAQRGARAPAGASSRSARPALRLLESAAGRGRHDRGRSPARPRSSSRRATAFRAVDVLMTNFHLPRSTLFMLVAAFSAST